jgi:hypothetical protein
MNSEVVLQKLQLGLRHQLSLELQRQIERDLAAEWDPWRREYELIVSTVAPERELGLRPDARHGTFLAESITFRAFVEPILGQLVLDLRAYVLAEQVARKQRTETFVFHTSAPASPWQFFKLRLYQRRWIPAWVRARFPVRQTRSEHVRQRTLTTEQFATFPASPITTPRHVSGPLIVRYERTDP